MSNNGQQIVPAGTTAAEAIGEKSLARSAETAGEAAAAHAEALVKAQFAVALGRPRSWLNVSTRLADHCRRPGFAKIARYSLPPRGGDKRIEGPSIRFVETSMQEMGNVVSSAVAVFDDADKQTIRVQVTDLERNITHSADVTILKTVERKSVADGRIPISSRTNSQGAKTYLLHATEDEMLQKRNSLVSKALRTLGQKLIPRDVLDDSMAIAIRTANDSAAADPAAEKKWIAGAFAALGIYPDKLAEYLGHPLDEATVDELTELRGLGQAIADGDEKWADVLAAKKAPAQEGAVEAKPVNPAAEKLKEKLAEKKGKAQPAAAAKESKEAAKPAAPPNAYQALLDALAKATDVNALWAEKAAEIDALPEGQRVAFIEASSERNKVLGGRQ